MFESDIFKTWYEKINKNTHHIYCIKQPYFIRTPEKYISSFTTEASFINIFIKDEVFSQYFISLYKYYVFPISSFIWFIPKVGK